MKLTPQYTKALADSLVVSTLAAVKDCGPEIAAQMLVNALESYACHAAGIIHYGDASYHIEEMVWYKSDGWDHGGSAISWQEEAEERQGDVKDMASLLEAVQVEATGPLCAAHEYDPTPTAEERLGRIAEITKDYAP